MGANLAEADYAALARRIAGKLLAGVELKPPQKRGASGVLCSIVGALVVEDRSWRIELRLPRGFPRELPQVFVDAELAGQLPHVGADGRLCVLQEEGASGDYERPGDQISQIIALARTTLERLHARASSAVVVEELESYCVATSRVPSAPMYHSPGSEVRFLRALWKGGRYVGVAADDLEIDRFFGAEAARAQHRHAVYVPMTEAASSALTLPLPFAVSAAAARTFIVRHCADPAGLKRALAKSPKGPILVLLGFPRGSARSVAGLEVVARGSEHPLSSRARAPHVSVVPIERRDRSALVPRGGADADLAQCSVVLVGCGAVGGYVAQFLAQSGVGRLTLVDHDHVQPGNLFRHILGSADIGENKAVAVARALRRTVPYCDVEALAARGDDLYDESPRAFSRDLVVLATGKTSVELYLSDSLRRHQNPPLVVSWLEPLGLGGHVFSAGRGSGCLRCLYDEYGHSRADFAARRQSFAVVHAGCGGAHTPFSNLDAVKTAELTVRQSLALLREPHRQPRLDSWRGDPAKFRAEGYRTSHRFDVPHESLSIDPRPLDPCPVCGSVLP